MVLRRNQGFEVTKTVVCWQNGAGTQTDTTLEHGGLDGTPEPKFKLDQIASDERATFGCEFI
jgi:hypothetical protein